MAFYVYLLASRRNGTLYIGMTDDVLKRVWQHRRGVVAGFTRDYGVKTLVWYEQHESRESALIRERQIKNGIEPGSLSLLKAVIRIGTIWPTDWRLSKAWVPASAGTNGEM
jgi:putative endonuclease